MRPEVAPSLTLPRIAGEGIAAKKTRVETHGNLKTLILTFSLEGEGTGIENGSRTALPLCPTHRLSLDGEAASVSGG